MGEILKLKIQLRRDTVANWELYDPVLLNGEAAVSSDLNKIKIGDGISKWSELEYVNGEALNGLSAAETGSYPIKQSDGTIKWVLPSTSTLEGVNTTLSAHEEEIDNLKSILNNTPKVALKTDDSTYEQDENGIINIPMATLTKLGVVKSSENENQIKILEDGTMAVNDINVNKLSQTVGDSLIFNGGDAETI